MQWLFSYLSSNNNVSSKPFSRTMSDRASEQLSKTQKDRLPPIKFPPRHGSTQNIIVNNNKTFDTLHYNMHRAVITYFHISYYNYRTRIRRVHSYYYIQSSTIVQIFVIENTISSIFKLDVFVWLKFSEKMLYCNQFSKQERISEFEKSQ